MRKYPQVCLILIISPYQVPDDLMTLFLLFGPLLSVSPALGGLEVRAPSQSPQHPLSRVSSCPHTSL